MLCNMSYLFRIILIKYMNRSKIQNRSIKILKNEMTPQQIEEIRDTFDLLDVNKINKISYKDLKIGMIALGLTPSEEDYARILKQIKGKSEIDHNNIDNESNEYLSFQEFYETVSFRLVRNDHN